MGDIIRRPEGGLIKHPVYTRAKALVRQRADELEEQDEAQFRAGIIGTLRENFPEFAKRIEDEGLLAQEISEAIFDVKRDKGLSRSMDEVRNELGL